MQKKEKHIPADIFSLISKEIYNKPQTISLAKRVLVDGDSQKKVALDANITKGRVSQAVKELWDKYQKYNK